MYLIPLGIGIFYLFLGIARILFPYVPSYPYSWITSTISRLGWPEVNEVGWIFFSIAMVLLGTFSLPLVLYKYRRFSQLNRHLAKFIGLFMFGICISLILLGLIPNYLTPDKIFIIIHGINAIILIGGGSLMLIIEFIIILRAHFKKNAIYSHQLIILYLILGIYTFFCITMLFITAARIGGLGGHYVYDPSTPLFLSMPMWEWQTMVMLLFMIAMPCYILPDKV
jgi:hypothetical protein